MKRLINTINKVLAAFILTSILFSCEYKEFVDTDYPDQLIYMPAAVYNNYMIDEIPAAVGESPTPGYIERYKIDEENNTFSVLLGAYRSGIDADGGFMINIEANTDTISQMLSIVDALPEGTILLPSANYSLVSSVKMEDGERLAKFNLDVDLNYLQNSAPDGKFAMGVSISSSERDVNPDLATTIIVIDTKILE